MARKKKTEKTEEVVDSKSFVVEDESPVIEEPVVEKPVVESTSEWKEKGFASEVAYLRFKSKFS